MKTLFYHLCLIILWRANLEAYMEHSKSTINEEWKVENLDPFDELMLSWNALRPTKGKLLFFISVKTDEWSPWLLYSSWGNDGQSSFLTTANGIKVYQDTLEILNGEKATAFQVKIMTEGSAELSSIHGLHVYTNSDKSKGVKKMDSCLNSIYLKVLGLSQMTVNHSRHRDLCSPTSTTAVVRHLLNDHSIDPVCFADNAWDSGFNIFGNWVFNVAEASEKLGNYWNCWVERLNGFDALYEHLEQGSPIIVSVRGPLPGSAQEYAQGHLMAVIGYDSLNQKVICIDPAFPTDSETLVSYAFSDFVQAWSRRGNVAYIFSKNKKLE